MEGTELNNLGMPKIDLTKFLKEPPVHEINGKSVNAQSLIDSVSMISIKLNSSNVEFVKKLTTEGLSKKQRLENNLKIREQINTDIFELSTCNRVLYVGFGIDSTQLESSVLSVSKLNHAPFSHHSGIDVWRQLVKVCSGLDSFMIGELQVMSQFRGSGAWHRKHNLISDVNSSFFNHVISANRVLRREFGFTQTTESMLNLATNAIEEVLSNDTQVHNIVLGFGEMGTKAVETLLSLNQENITVISRNPKKAVARNNEISKKVSIISFEEWKSSPIESALIISTIRNVEPTFCESNPVPYTGPCKIMDFSWPPSVDISGTDESQHLLGMEHWIKAAHNLGVEWDYSNIINQSNSMIDDIQSRFMMALTDRVQAKFRAHIYQTLESLSKQWELSKNVGDSVNELGAFSREIATWICNQKGPFSAEELDKMVLSTSRPINPILLKRAAFDVTEAIIRINGLSALSEATS